MSIPPRFLEDLRARLTLSDVIGKRVRLVRAGREYKGCCPFHKEKTPSFTVSDAKQFYYCFGCGAKGDVIKFVMEHDNLDFPAAVEMLAAEAGMQVPKASPSEIEKSRKQNSLYDLLEETSEWFQDQLCLPGNAAVLDYVRGRGLSEETIRAFGVGYAPDDYDSLKTHLKERGYTEAQMLAAGVLKKSDRDGKTYSFFRGRIITPVRDMRSRVVAFGGRILPGHLRPPERGDFTPPKYINTGDTEIFHKSRILYGGETARVAAGQGKPVVVVEGYFDVIAAHQAGFTGAVAPMGTALTEEQVILLWKLIPVDPGEVKEPILCFDGDTAGRRAAERACKLILPMLEAGRSARFAFLPEGEDPDSLIRGGGAGAFQAILSSAMPFFDMLWSIHTAGKSFKTPDSRAALTKMLADELAQIGDREVHRQYESLLKERLFRNFYKKDPRRTGRASEAPAAGARLHSPLRQGLDLKTRILLAAVLNYPEIYEQIEEQFWQFPIANPAHERLRQEMIRIFLQNPGLDRKRLHSQIGDGDCAGALDEVLSGRTMIHARFCGPGYDPETVRQKWLDVMQSIHAGAVQEEIQKGWKLAFRNADEKEEDKLRALLQQTVRSGGGE